MNDELQENFNVFPGKRQKLSASTKLIILNNMLLT